jgi:hypothetical protein
MGANAQTAVPAFTAGQVLTAAQQTQINTGIPVFATTVTRDAAFDGAGEKALAEGQFAYIEATNTTQYYDGAAWQSVGVSPGLVLVSSTTIGTTVSSVTVSSAFSATYDNYKIILSGGLSSVSTNMKFTLGATATGYTRFTFQGAFSANTVSGSGATNQSDWNGSSLITTNCLTMDMELQNPFLTKRTVMYSRALNTITIGEVFLSNGFLDDATSYTAFTLTPASGTLTGGTIRVYGYANS